MKKVLLVSLILFLVGFGFSSCGNKRGDMAGVDNVSGEEQASEGAQNTSMDSEMGSSSLSLSDLERVYFDFNNATLRPDARDTLKKDYEILKKYPNASIKVEGHCDERGSEEYNLALGERRAEAIKRYLSNLGLTGSKMNIISYGEEKPLIMGHSESAWSKNRRGEIVVQ